MGPMCGGPFVDRHRQHRRREAPGRLHRLLAVQAQGQVERRGRLAGRDQDHVEHPRAVPLVERQAAGQECVSVRAGSQFQVVRRGRAGVRRDRCLADDPAEQRRPLVPPGEAGAVVGVPRVALRRPLRATARSAFPVAAGRARRGTAGGTWRARRRDRPPAFRC